MGLRVYVWLLGALPASFRAEYGRELRQTVEDHWREVGPRVGWWGGVRFWWRQWLAVAEVAVTLRLDRDPAGPVRARQSLILTATLERRWVMGDAVRDVRQAARALLRRPGFTLVTVLTLGLGIGATTAIFSAVHAVLLRPLPYAGADRVVTLWQVEQRTGERGEGMSAADVRDIRERSRTLSEAAVAEPYGLDLLVDGGVVSLQTWLVSEGYFEVVPAEPVVGRLFLPEEYEAGKDRVVLLGYRLWRGRYGGDPAVVGSTLTLDGEPYTVVGVLPEDYKFPDRKDLWAPRASRERDAGQRASAFLSGVARLAPGATVGRAQAELERIAAGLAAEYPATNAGRSVRVVPLREHLFGDVRTPLYVLLGAVVLVLLIACANVAGLLLARGVQREREYALRGALGASRGRLAGHLTAESLLLALGGGVVGVLLAVGGVSVIRSLAPPEIPRIDELRLDGTVLAFAALLAVASALLASLAPSFRLSRPDLQQALAEGARSVRGGRGRLRLRNGLVIAEIALSVMLLIGAGLLFRSFARLLDNELGFDPASRVAVQLFAYGYPPGGREAFIEQSLERIEALPGVRGAAVTSTVPLATDGAIASIEIDIPYTVERRAPPPVGQEPIAFISYVSEGYFDVMEIPLARGRAFEDGDRPDAPAVVLVNETLARRQFDGAALGESLRIGTSPVPREIVGVARDVRPAGFESEPQPEIYVPLSQVSTGSLTFVVHTEGDAGALLEPVRQAIWSVNPVQSIWGGATLETLLASWLKERRFNLFLLGAFALIAIFLAAIGIYGLISFSMEQRTGELGIRRALGGRAGHLIGMVMREGAMLGAWGVLLGLLGAAAATRFLQTMLVGVTPTDPVTFLGLAVLVLGVTAAATYLPARRAVRVDPMTALRSE